jgi:hypothetical protein
MKSASRVLILALVAVAFLSACGPIPQPFRGGPKVTSDNPLLDVPAATGVAILPIMGLPPETSDAYTKAVADRLDAMEIPAAAVAKAGALGFIASGTAANIVDSPTGQTFDVAWTLKSRHGDIVARFVQSVRISPGEAGNVAAAGASARQIAYHMGLGPEPTQAAATAPAAPVLPSVSVKPVEGAHGDGRTSLALAVLQALSDAGMRRDDVNPDVSLFATITTKPEGFDSQDVTIAWRAVLRDGRELGSVKVQNTIPVGALDGAWGPTAFSIAAAAQKDLVRLISAAPPDTAAKPAPDRKPEPAKKPKTTKKH